MVFFHHQVFSQGILKVLGPSFVGLVFVNERKHPLGNFVLQLVVSQCSKSDNVLVVIKNVTYCKEFSGILITVVNSNLTATKSDVKADSEVSWLEWHLGSVTSEDHLSLEEGSLWGSTVGLRWLGDDD